MAWAEREREAREVSDGERLSLEFRCLLTVFRYFAKMSKMITSNKNSIKNNTHIRKRKREVGWKHPKKFPCRDLSSSRGRCFGKYWSPTFATTPVHPSSRPLLTDTLLIRGESKLIVKIAWGWPLLLKKIIFQVILIRNPREKIPHLRSFPLSFPFSFSFPRKIFWINQSDNLITLDLLIPNHFSIFLSSFSASSSPRGDAAHRMSEKCASKWHLLWWGWLQLWPH